MVIKQKRCNKCFNCVRVYPDFKFICLKGMWCGREYALETVNASLVLDTISCICPHYDDDENSDTPIDWGAFQRTKLRREEVYLGEDTWVREY